MRMSLILLASVAAYSLAAAPEQTNSCAVGTNQPPSFKRTASRHKDEVGGLKSHQITYDGISMKVMRSENPLQLINPMAPKKYGPGEANVVRDPVTSKPTGLKLFSLSW